MNLENFNIAIEFNNLEASKSRLSLYYFIINNRWFNGTIFLLNTSREEISISNLNILKNIYEKIEIIDRVESVNSWITSCKFNVLFFKNTWIFLRSIENVNFEKSFTIQDLSIIFKLSNDLFESIDGIELANLNESLIFSSNLPNNLWRKNILYDIRKIAINFDALHLPLYSQINQIWMAKNHEFLNYLRKPKRIHIFTPKIKTDHLINKNKYYENIKIDSISKLDLSNYKSVLCTICNDSFLPGAKVLISSFLKNNIEFEGDIVVFYSENYSSLSIESQTELLKISNKIIFKKINEKDYLDVFLRFKNIYAGTNKLRFLPSLFTYEAFDLANEYDKILYLDSDMLILSNIMEVFSLTQEIVATPDTSNFNINGSYNQFNGGFLFINSSKIVFFKFIKFHSKLS
jgi:lipopolysaccharide biosynthesis glycosyltransferase